MIFSNFEEQFFRLSEVLIVDCNLLAITYKQLD